MRFSTIFKDTDVLDLYLKMNKVVLPENHEGVPLSLLNPLIEAELSRTNYLEFRLAPLFRKWKKTFQQEQNFHHSVDGQYNPADYPATELRQKFFKDFDEIQSSIGVLRSIYNNHGLRQELGFPPPTAARYTKGLLADNESLIKIMKVALIEKVNFGPKLNRDYSAQIMEDYILAFNNVMIFAPYMSADVKMFRYGQQNSLKEKWFLAAEVVAGLMEEMDALPEPKKIVNNLGIKDNIPQVKSTADGEPVRWFRGCEPQLEITITDQLDED